MRKEFAVEVAISNIRFGPGITSEVGMDLAEMKARRVLVLTDPHLRGLLVAPRYEACAIGVRSL